MLLIKPSTELLTPLNRQAILEHLELCGRVCYKSEDKITEDSASRFCTKIQTNQHHSVIEHHSVSVRFIIDRGVSHELVRHRLASYSQESTRYCNYSKKGITFIIPPWLEWITPRECNPEEVIAIGQPHPWLAIMALAELGYDELIKQGWTPQQARSVLPNSLKTEVIMTANLREWQHVFRLRCAASAHPQMREVMIPLRDSFIKELPELFNVR